MLVEGKKKPWKSKILARTLTHGFARWRTASKSASHIPLAWMVREAIRVGLVFDDAKLASVGLGVLKGGTEEMHPTSSGLPVCEQYSNSLGGQGRTATELQADKGFHQELHQAHSAPIHDCLSYGGGLDGLSVTGWKLMEYLPLRYLEKGTYHHWPPRGRTRNLPADAQVHSSVLCRMMRDMTYQPSNLLDKKMPNNTIGPWSCVSAEGSMVSEAWVRATPSKRAT